MVNIKFPRPYVTQFVILVGVLLLFRIEGSPVILAQGGSDEIAQEQLGAFNPTESLPSVSSPQLFLPMIIGNVGADAGGVTDVRVASSWDDGEESVSGIVSLESGDLELVDTAGENQTAAIRFDGVDIPQGVTIVNAYIQFKVDERSVENASLTIQGEATGNAANLDAANANISLRTRTTAAVEWSPEPWATVGDAGLDQRTPDLAAVIQEIVSLPSWSRGNALVAVVSGSGVRTAESYDGDQAGAPLLHVEYEPSPVLIGAGDISSCGNDNDQATSELLDNVVGTVFTLGDNVYPDGAAIDFRDCYDPTWGRHKARTRPATGNHDYLTEGASGYFDYFGATAGEPDKGYYSYDLGDWHIVVLNSSCLEVGGCGIDSPQGEWLQADLEANATACTLAYWHHPLFSSGYHANNSHYQDFWQMLYAAEADVVLNGHEHSYERFALQDPNGVADPERGIREFVVGTGGGSLRPFGAIHANSEVRNFDAYGVLKLTLHPSGYDWDFLPIAGQSFTDSGSESCVGVPGDN